MKVLIFIVLKIVEVLGVVFTTFYLGKWMFPEDMWFMQWVGGLLIALVGILALVGTGLGVFGLVVVNWYWAENIKNKLRR